MNWLLIYHSPMISCCLEPQYLAWVETPSILEKSVKITRNSLYIDTPFELYRYTVVYSVFDEPISIQPLR